MTLVCLALCRIIPGGEVTIIQKYRVDQTAEEAIKKKVKGIQLGQMKSIEDQDIKVSFHIASKNDGLVACCVSDLEYSNHIGMFVALSLLDGEQEDKLADIFRQFQTPSEPDKIVKLESEIDDEIIQVHETVSTAYAKKFLDLKQIIKNPIHYALLVSGFGDCEDMTKVNLPPCLSKSEEMGVKIAASICPHIRVFDKTELTRILNGCDAIINLGQKKQQLLYYIESLMPVIAPNVTSMVGAAVAAKLITLCGGLDKMSQMPACNILLLGATHGNDTRSIGKSEALVHSALLYSTQLVQDSPAALRIKTARILSGRVAMCARVDISKKMTTGIYGNELKEEIMKKIEKMNEPPPPKLVKPLPLPPSQRKKKRGGQRHRKTKEKYAVTEVRKQQNRIQFGGAEKETDGLSSYESGKGFGMLGIAGSGQIKVNTKASDLKISKKAQKSWGK